MAGYQKLAWVVLGALALALHARAEPNKADADFAGAELRYNAQVGVDVWRLTPAMAENYLLMPNKTVWHYRPESPWATLDGQYMLRSNAVLTLKARANQTMGSHIDEVSLDWAYSPSFGFKAGVVGYKTSWCRTYDLDSPWVQENDPFCTFHTTSDASNGAPGVQLYVNSDVGPYQIQGVAGVYRPLFGNFNTQEFSNVPIEHPYVDRNSKKGVSLGVLHTESAAELRVGFLSAIQSARAVDDSLNEAYRVNQTYNMVFAGLSFYVTPKANVRVQTLRHDMTSSNWSLPGSSWPNYRGGLEVARRSDVIELNYQLRPQDVLALAVSKYHFDITTIASNYPMAGYTRSRDSFVFLNTAWSASWRHDWSRGVFTAAQWTYNKLDLNDRRSLDFPEVRTATGHGLGLRLGYQF